MQYRVTTFVYVLLSVTILVMDGKIKLNLMTFTVNS